MARSTITATRSRTHPISDPPVDGFTHIVPLLQPSRNETTLDASALQYPACTKVGKNMELQKPVRRKAMMKKIFFIN